MKKKKERHGQIPEFQYSDTSLHFSVTKNPQTVQKDIQKEKKKNRLPKKNPKQKKSAMHKLIIKRKTRTDLFCNHANMKHNAKYTHRRNCCQGRQSKT